MCAEIVTHRDDCRREETDCIGRTNVEGVDRALQPQHRLSAGHYEGLEGHRISPGMPSVLLELVIEIQSLIRREPSG